MKKLAIFAAIIISLNLTGCKTERSQDVVSTPPQSLPTIESTQTDLFLSAQATKEFSDDVVTDAQIEKLLKAAVKSPNTTNSQPWHFTAVMKEGYIKELVPNATKGCVIIIVSAPSGNIFDCGIATQSINLAAQSMGLGANIYMDKISYINSEDIKRTYKIPEGYDAVSLVCVGYPKSDAISGASERNDLESFVTYID